MALARAHLTDLAEGAAEAFTEGWLLSGCVGEFTEAEFRAAVGSALDCAHDPAVLEATLEIGKLAGTWKTVYDRRERLLRKHLKAVMKAWDACLAELDPPRDLVRQFRSVMDLTAESSDPQKDWWKDAATTAALAWLRALYRTDGYAALVAALEDAIRSGMAEGEADALALAASRQGKTGFSIAKAFKAAYAKLAGDQVAARQAQDVLAKITAGAAGDAGRALTAQAGDGGSEEDMTAAVDDVLSGDDSSVSRWTDWALWGAFGLGALLLSQLAGVATYDWLDVGDSRECAQCEQNASGSPYQLGDLPSFPAHPRCRCDVQPSDAFSLSGFLSDLLS